MAMFSLVVAVLIISQGLQSAGVVGLISEQINQYLGYGVRRLLIWGLLAHGVAAGDYNYYYSACDVGLAFVND